MLARHKELSYLYSLPQKETGNPPVIFVHGACLGSWAWEDFLNYFAEHGYPAYAIDLPGHGESPTHKPQSAYGIEDYATSVSRFARYIEKKHGDPVVLVGHSMGGLVAQKVAERETLTALILIAPAPPASVHYQWGSTLNISFFEMIHLSLIHI